MGQPTKINALAGEADEKGSATRRPAGQNAAPTPERGAGLRGQRKAAAQGGPDHGRGQRDWPGGGRALRAGGGRSGDRLPQPLARRRGDPEPGGAGGAPLPAFGGGPWK